MYFCSHWSGWGSDWKVLSIITTIIILIYIKRECISVHIGQAGVQMGNACWELYCLEHGNIHLYNFFSIPFFEEDLFSFYYFLFDHIMIFLYSVYIRSFFETINLGTSGQSVSIPRHFIIIIRNSIIHIHV